MKFEIDKDLTKKIAIFTLVGVNLIVIYAIVTNFQIVTNILARILAILNPIIVGMFIAMILEPFMSFFENKLPSFYSDKSKRIIALIISITILLLFIIVFLQILIPQLVESITKLANSTTDVFISNGDLRSILIDKLRLDPNFVNQIMISLNDLVAQLSKLLQSIVPSIIAYSVNIVKALISLILGLVVAVYLLLDKENFKLQVKRAFNALFNKVVVSKATDIYHMVIRMFNSFLIGKIIDSLIIGLLTFIVLSLFKIHYALLIAFIVGVTNIIPTFGPFIGAIPAVIILLLVDPIEALYFMGLIL